MGTSANFTIGDGTVILYYSTGMDGMPGGHLEEILQFLHQRIGTADTLTVLTDLAKAIKTETQGQRFMNGGLMDSDIDYEYVIELSEDGGYTDPPVDDKLSAINLTIDGDSAPYTAIIEDAQWVDHCRG